MLPGLTTLTIPLPTPTRAVREAVTRKAATINGMVSGRTSSHWPPPAPPILIHGRYAVTACTGLSPPLPHSRCDRAASGQRNGCPALPVVLSSGLALGEPGPLCSFNGIATTRGTDVVLPVEARPTAAALIRSPIRWAVVGKLLSECGDDIHTTSIINWSRRKAV